MPRSGLERRYAQFMQGIYGAETQANEWVKASDKLSAEAHFAIYRSSVWGNLSKALADIFPAVQRCVGERFFSAMASRYIERFPSRSASLDNYGEHLADFILGFEPLKEYPYLADLACLELAWHRAFHAGDSAPLDLKRLADLSVEQHERLIFKLPLGSKLLESNYPIKLLWDENRWREPEHPIELRSGDYRLLVWRNGLETCIDELAESEFDFLREIEKQQKFGTICTQLLSKYPHEVLNKLAAKAVSTGWISDFHI